jgi:Ni/Co efflux regulator RcnB
MTKPILSALAMTLTLGTLAPAVADARPLSQRTVVTERHGGHVTRTVTTRHWRRGERFDRRYAQNYREIDYRRYRGLRAPPRGYHYVRSGNDALLVGVTSGIIASVIAGAIR